MFGRHSGNRPVVVLVSIPQQTMHVYRNDILIGHSTVSKRIHQQMDGTSHA
jgi:hypothetical protein